MKKGLIASAVAMTVAGALIAPHFIGQQIEQLVNEQVAQLNQQAGYQASVKEYQRGWFDAKAVIQVHFDMHQLDPAADMPAFPVFNINLALTHGPVVLSSQGLLGLSAWQADVAADTLREKLSWAEDKPIYRLSGVSGLFGGHSFSDQMPAWRFQEKDNSQIQFSGYQGSGEILSQSMYYSGKAQSLLGEENGERRLAFNELQIDMHADVGLATMMEGGFYDSKTRISLAQLLISVPGTEIGEVDASGLAIEVKSSRNADKGTGNMELAYLADNIAVAGQQASDLVMQVQLQDINEGVLMEYQKLARTGDAADPQTMMQFIEENLPIALLDSPALNLSKLSGNLPMGKFDGYINSRIKLQDDAMDSDWMYREFWLSNLLVDAQLNADKEVLLFVAKQQMLGQMQGAILAGQIDEEQAEQMAAERAPMMLEMLQQQGLLVETPEGYQSTFSLKQGEALLNGEPMPLPL